MFDNTLSCPYLKGNATDTQQATDEVGKLMETVPSSVVTIFCSFYIFKWYEWEMYLFIYLFNYLVFLVISTSITAARCINEMHLFL